MDTDQQQPDPHTTIEGASLGLSGQFGHLVFVGVHKDGKELGTPGGTAGDYRVVLTLSKPRFSLHPENTLWPERDLQGDSNLELAGSVPMKLAFTSDVNYRGQAIEYKAYTNERNAIGKFVIDRLYATSRLEAESTAYSGLAPFLSLLATRYDIPLDVYQIDVTEIATETSSFSYTKDFHTIRIDGLPSEAIADEDRGFFSIYREAIVTASPFYQFLSFYKICEELFKRRGRLGPEVAAGTRAPFNALRIPGSVPDVEAFLRTIHPLQQSWNEQTMGEAAPMEARGKSLRSVMDDYLRPIRDRIAHALFQDDANAPTLLNSFDNGEHLSAVHKWLPFLRTSARWHMREDLGLKW
jgi:hypothetical protein